MNSKFLVWTSLLIALLLHLAFFNLTVFVFPIDPVAFKPKFFFLGPILSKNDVKQVSFNNSTASNSMFQSMRSTKDHLKSIGPEIADRTENPFAIQSIKKPLMPQTDETQKKIVIKPTFESSPEKGALEEAEIQRRSSSELKIPSYKPLLMTFCKTLITEISI